MSDPLYSSEYVDAAADVLRRFLVPGAGRRRPARRARGRAGAGAVQGPPDGQGGAGDGRPRRRAARRRAGRFARELGAVHDRVPCGVSVGIMDSIPALLDAVGGYLDEGYVRIKLKIEPGWDVEPVRAVRERFGDDVLLQVDANTAYTLADARHLARLDPFDLLLIEQPLDEEDVLGPRRPGQADPDAGLPGRVDRLGAVRGRRDPARRLRRSSTSSPAGSAATSRRGGSTTSASRTASRSGAAACSRPGSAGPRTSRWPRCPGFTLPGDTSASGRYYRTDITDAVRARRRPPRRADRARPRRRAAGRRAGRGDRLDRVARRLTTVDRTNEAAIWSGGRSRLQVPPTVESAHP